MNKKTDGCGKHFPRLPCDWTILSSPPPQCLSQIQADNLVAECVKVKINVRKVLDDLYDTGHLDDVMLVDVLQLALGDPELYWGEEAIAWSNGKFPICDIFKSWRDKLRRIGGDHVLLFSLYYTALTISTWRVDGRLVCQLLVKRKVCECFTVDYNPFLLEEMASNMELSLVVFTPKKLLNYITKEQKAAFSITEAVREVIENGEDSTLENVLKVINSSRTLSLAEAFYRVDTSLFLTESNMPVLHIDSDLPHKRKRFFIKSPEGPDVLPGCRGRYRELSELFDDYVANRYDIS